MSEKESLKNGWYTVIISALVGCSISAAFPQFSMTVTELSEKTGLSEAFLLSGDTLKSAAIVVAMLLSGVCYRKFGARVSFILSMVFTIVPQIAIPFTSSPFLFMVFKAIQGLTSIIFPILLIIVMDAVPDRQNGLATAVFNGVFYSGGGIGGTIAGVFITHWGWLSSYYAIAVIEAVLGLIWILTVKVEKPQEAEEERIEKTPYGKLLLMPKVWLLIIAFLSTTFVVQAITVDLPLFSYDIGWSSSEVAASSTAVSLGLILSCLVSGKISDVLALRMDNKAVARIIALAAGPVLIILASTVMITVNLESKILYYTVCFLLSFGGSWGFGTFYSILPEMFDRETLPDITGLAGGAGDCGMPLAPLLVGVVFGSRGMWKAGWSVCMIFAALSIVACIILCLNVKKQQKTM